MPWPNAHQQPHYVAIEKNLTSKILIKLTGTTLVEIFGRQNFDETQKIVTISLVNNLHHTVGF